MKEKAATIAQEKAAGVNYKLLFPTYRNRFLFIEQQLDKLANKDKDIALNLGTGEGDYDPMIAKKVRSLMAVDINPQDLAYAKVLNSEVRNLEYQIEDAHHLSFEDQTFQVITSVDVIEHVDDPSLMVAEIGRVLAPGGVALITFPQRYFPWTYDPINWILTRVSSKKIPQGAFAFGHAKLIDPQSFETWVAEANMEVIHQRGLSYYIVALLEMYWTGIIQKIFKSNAGNVTEASAKRFALRPATKSPFGVSMTDWLLRKDSCLFNGSKYSVGKAYILRKMPSN